VGGRVSAVRVWTVLGLLFSSFGWTQSTPIPSIVLSTSKSEIAAGKTARISWTSTNANRCVGSGPGWSQTYEGTAAARGSFTSAALNDRTNTFVLTCTGPGGTASQSLTILALPKPEVTLTANPDRALPGGSVTLGWQSTNATSCSASGAPFTGTKPISGTETLTGLTKGAKKLSLSCKGIGGTTKATTEVAVVPAPTLTFSASKTQIPENTATQLKWKATDATTCIASGDWSGEQKTSGSFPTGNLTEDQTYTLSCEGLNGEVEQTVTVQVVGAPQVSLSVAQEVIAPGENVAISWDVQDAQSCKASGSPFTGDKNINGGAETLENLTKGNKTFKLTCKGGGGTTTAEANLAVIPKPTLSFTGPKTEIAEGKAAKLTWRAKDAIRCEASGDWSGDKGISGSADTGPLTSDKTYTLNCIGQNGEVEETVNVAVVPAPKIALTLSDTLIEPGTSFSIAWSSEYATSCTAGGGGWAGTKSLEGSESASFATAGKRLFTLTCRGVGGTTSAQAELGVFPPPKILSFTADPILLQVGQSTTLRWQTQDTRSCSASGAWSGPQALNSSGVSSSSLTQRTNVFTLNCQGDGGDTSSSLTVEAREAPEVMLTIDRALITSGERVTLNWSSREATSCTASGAWSGTKALSGSEASTALDAGNFTFTLRCVNAIGSNAKSVSVESARPQADLDVASVDFGNAGTGATLQRILKLKNTGKVAVTALTSWLTGENSDQFVITTPCVATLVPSAECDIGVSFKPTTSGPKRAVLEIRGAGYISSVPLSGRGAFEVLTVTKSGTGSGTVTSSPAGIDCGSDCTESYNVGTSVTLTAAASNDSTFTGWSGACTGTGACTVSMSETKSVTATFVLKSFALTVTKSGTGSGTVTSDVGTLNCGNVCTANYAFGTVVRLIATAAAGSTFSGWSGACTGVGACAVTVSEATTVTANFGSSISVSDLSLSLNVLGFGESKVTGRLSVTGHDGEPIAFAVQSQGALGQATVGEADGLVTYTVASFPSLVSATTDRVTVRVTAGAVSAVASVNIAIRFDPLLPNQWHLRNVGQYTFSDVRPTPGFDINIAPAWANGYSGAGVKVGIVDSGLEIAHEDLSSNVSAASSINFLNNGTDTSSSDGYDHGTMVGGIVGAVGFNGKGGRGIAYRAQLRGYNAIMRGLLAEDFARSFGQDERSKDNDVFNGSFGGDETTAGAIHWSLPSFSNTRATVLNETTSLRNGKGAVVVMSAGNNFSDNGRAGACINAEIFGVSCSLPATGSYKQSVVPIIVGAISADGKKASYSNSAASIWVSAPGGEYGREAVYQPGLPGDLYKPAIVTPTTTGCEKYTNARNALDSRGTNSLSVRCQYTATMNGTSSAAPMVSGVVALMLEANPNLTYRDVAHILAVTARKIDVDFPGVVANLAGAQRQLEDGWTRNAAGYTFSNRYGFGLVDAGAAVAMARTYSNYLPGWKVAEAPDFQAGGSVDIGANGKFVSFPISSSVKHVEKVFVLVDLFTRNAGASGATCNQIELTSPAGTRSILLNAANGFQNARLDSVLLSSNAFYGENPNGTWKMTVFDWCGSVPVTPTQYSLLRPQEFALIGH
jgi:subtilisin family serine protease